jgi:hypothetical protein
MEHAGTLTVERLKGSPGKFIVLLVNTQEGHILESSNPLTEDEVREVPASNYGESSSQIEARIRQASANP